MEFGGFNYQLPGHLGITQMPGSACAVRIRHHGTVQVRQAPPLAILVGNMSLRVGLRGITDGGQCLLQDSLTAQGSKPKAPGCL